MDFAKATEIAEQLAVTPETVRSMCRTGTLPAYRIVSGAATASVDPTSRSGWQLRL